MDRKTKYLTVYTFGTTRQVFWVEDKRAQKTKKPKTKNRKKNAREQAVAFVDFLNLISQNYRRSESKTVQYQFFLGHV